MQGTESGSRTRIFGVFEVDVHAGELRKHGVRVKLQDQPFRILLHLIERPGELVSREELRKDLWPDETFVDFDRNLNKAIAKLRSALGDSAECPRYIETVPRHGYRFLLPIAPGRVTEAPNALAIRVAKPAGHVASEMIGRSAALRIEKPAQLFYSLTEGWGFSLLMGALVTVIAVAAIAAIGTRSAGVFGTGTGAVNLRRSVAVLGFRNLSGDPQENWLSTAFSDWLATDLSAGGGLRTVSADSIARMKMELALPDLESPGHDSLQRIRKNLGTDLVVAGSYAILGLNPEGQMRLDIKLVDTRTGEILYANCETGTHAKMFDVVSQAGEDLRRKLGLREVTRREAEEVALALPGNTEAAQLYAEGLSRLRVFDVQGAQKSLLKAVAVEPNYALSHAALASAWVQLGYGQNAAAEAKKAFDLSANLSRVDRLLVEGKYHELSNDWDKAIETYGALFKFYPDNPDYGLELANAQIGGNKWRDALETIEALRALPSPLRDDPRLDLAQGEAALHLGDTKQAEAALKNAEEKARAAGASLLLAKAKLAQVWLYESLGRVAEVDPALQEANRLYQAAQDREGLYETETLSAIKLQILGDYAQAQKKYEDSLAIVSQTGDQRGMAAGHDNLGDILFFLGNIHAATTNYEDVLRIYQEIKDDNGVALAKIALGDVLVVQGKLEQAKQMYEDAREICHGNGNRIREAEALYGLGQVLHMQGDFADARQVESQAHGVFKESGDVTHEAQTELALAELMLDQGEKQEAVTPAEEAARLLAKAKAMREAAMANVLLSRVWLAQGKPWEARESLAYATQFAERSHDEQIAVSVILAEARIDTLGGDPGRRADTVKRLSALDQEARDRGYLYASMEARLALGEIEMKSPAAEDGRALVKELQREASKGGFRLMADKAGAVLQDSSYSYTR
jgi:eukaryotic-like serine/threonine-protein kinase